ncbi:hypothetical protein DFP72DRAFT_906743 [Ephemerocybe angulata]|uniref:Phosphatidate phosphatase APP1 catalytic domain-containing protein n=1 Tax=Ephemerocybe angulata TaxID=980116 RepID=A0A8H6M248_9AGAR|nr:hypothetical protein DFP72DRAFT_906743 [Tulosesus angulatus]
MRPFSFLSILALTATHSLAIPTRYITPAERGLLDAPGVLDNVILFDAPAFPDPQNPENTLAFFQAYVSLRTPDLGVATTAITSLLSSLGINVGNDLNTLQQRIKLLASVGLPGKKLEVVVPGCELSGKLPATSVSDLGLAGAAVSLGSCVQNAIEMEASVLPGAMDSRKFTASIFPSKNSGFGVISDVDDTVKVSNVLDKVALLKSTFLETPKAVSGMPELYTSLSKSLQGPQFVYVTGSAYQFYPFLNEFIDTTYASAKGPIFTQNLTVLNIPQAVEFLTSNQGTLDFKVATIDRLQTMYPQKQWLAIGDSTQKDPEAYATAFKKRDTISCIWIRRVEGADNSDERFNTAFADVPAGKFRTFNDTEIPKLADIDVAGGQC